MKVGKGLQARTGSNLGHRVPVSLARHGSQRDPRRQGLRLLRERSGIIESAASMTARGANPILTYPVSL